MTNKKEFDISDFSVDIYERDDAIHVRVDCFAYDGVHAPFGICRTSLISKTFAINEVVLYHTLSTTIANMVNDIINSDIQRPEPCECWSREWFDKHPYDRYEYWRTNSGRIYPKDHTVHCPKNPCKSKEQR